MMTLAVFAAMILISTSLRVLASAGAVAALTCRLRLFWDLTRLMRTSVLPVAAKNQVSRRFPHALHQSLSDATLVLFTTLQVRRFGVRNRATHTMTCSAHLPGRRIDVPSCEVAAAPLNVPELNGCSASGAIDRGLSRAGECQVSN